MPAPAGMPRLSNAAARSRRSNIRKRGEARREERTSPKLSLIQSNAGSRVLFSKGSTIPRSTCAHPGAPPRKRASSAARRKFIGVSVRIGLDFIITKSQRVGLDSAELAADRYHRRIARPGFGRKIGTPRGDAETGSEPIPLQIPQVSFPVFIPLRVILAVGIAPDGLDPMAMVAIPPEGFRQARFEGDLGLPTQL